MKKYALIVLVVFGVAAAWAVQGNAAEEKAPAAPIAAPATAPPKVPPPPAKFDKVGDNLPPMTLKSLKGDLTVELDKMKKPALIMFVNSSCAACRAELYAFTKLAEKNKDKLATLVVSVDFDPQNTVTRFPDLAAMPYDVMDGSDFKVASALGFNFTPATVIADGSGKQVFRKGGFSSGDDALIGQEVIKLLK